MFVAVEQILDAECERKRVAGLRTDDVLHHDAGRLTLPDGPGCPADEAVDRVLVLRLGERQLVASPLELVAAVEQPVRPRDQHLPAARGADLVGAVAVEELPAAQGVRAEPAAHLDDYGALVIARELDLLAGRRAHRCVPGPQPRSDACPSCGWREAGLGRRWATAKDHAPMAPATTAANA
jgi:hypothetical protein